MLLKRDPSYVPANIALESCSVKNKKFTSKVTMTPGIQMGECYINARWVEQHNLQAPLLRWAPFSSSFLLSFPLCRIVPQAFAWFEPTDPYGAQNEGGLYGKFFLRPKKKLEPKSDHYLHPFPLTGNCYAASSFPTTEDLIYWENANYACFFWTEKNIPNQGVLPKLTGREIIPFPVACPHNLPGCYSKGIYSPGGIVSLD